MIIFLMDQSLQDFRPESKALWAGDFLMHMKICVCDGICVNMLGDSCCHVL